jgi:hypothetical protein
MERKKEKKQKIKVYRSFTVDVKADIDEEVEHWSHIKSGCVTIDMENVHDNIIEQIRHNTSEFRKQYSELSKIIEYLSKIIKVEKCNYEIEHRSDPRHYRGWMQISFVMNDRNYELCGYIVDCDTEVKKMRLLDINTYNTISLDDYHALKKELVTHHNLDCPKVFQYYFQKFAEHMDEQIDYKLC